MIYSNQEAVFEHYYVKPDLRARYYSPFNEYDSRPGCRFSVYQGKLYFIDNAQNRGKLSYDCVYYVAEIFGITYKQAIDKIIQEVKLIDNTIILDSGFKSIIKFKPSKLENTYFNQFDVNIKSIYGFRVQEYWCNTKQDLSLKKNRLGNPQEQEVYAFYFKKNEHVSLYFPNRTENKFYKNCEVNDMYGINRLNSFDFTKPLIITKSAKDVLVLNKYYNNVLGVQSETSFSFLSSFFSFPFIIIWFDNDYTGIKYAKLYEEFLRKKGINNIMINNHPDYLAKDPADMFLANKFSFENYLKYDFDRKVQNTFNI